MKKYFTILFTFIVLILAGCSKDKNNDPVYEINSTTLTTNYDKEFQFSIEGNPENIVWSSSDENVGTIDNTGLFKANKIGSTTITAKIGTASVKSEVTVESYGELFKEPYTDYGSNKASIKSKESRSLKAEISTALLYEGENNIVKDLLYLFENDKMQAASINFSYSSSIASQVGQFYGERYTYLGFDDDYIFMNNNKGSIIGISVNDSGDLNATYLSESSAKAASAIMSITKEGTLQSRIQALIR